MSNIFTFLVLSFIATKTFICFSLVLPSLDASLGDGETDYSFLHLYFPTVLNIEIKQDKWLFEFSVFGFGLSIFKTLDSIG